jgi:hypothetical protein
MGGDERDDDLGFVWAKFTQFFCQLKRFQFSHKITISFDRNKVSVDSILVSLLICWTDILLISKTNLF